MTMTSTPIAANTVAIAIPSATYCFRFNKPDYAPRRRGRSYSVAATACRRPGDNPVEVLLRERAIQRRPTFAKEPHARAHPAQLFEVEARDRDSRLVPWQLRELVAARIAHERASVKRDRVHAVTFRA